MYKTLSKIIGIFLLCFVSTLQVDAQKVSFDVLHYDAVITPSFADKSVQGEVSVEFTSLVKGLKEIQLSAGNLGIKRVREKFSNLKFEKKGKLLKIKLSRPLKINEKYEIKISYYGIPGYGIRFFPEQKQVYTIFSTSQWMPCVDSPNDRATFRLKLNFPQNTLVTVGNGRLLNQKLRFNNKKKSEYVWEQKTPIPTYLFGFAAGEFQEIREKHKNTVFRYLAPKQFSEVEIKKIFRDSADMLDFFESKAGVNYSEKIYTQVLAMGNAQQEMGGFTVMNEKYGRGVLKNEKAIWLGVHELAHQWWGNMVTNRNWNHFWLNEGITNFMTAAYLEHRFGQDKYKSEIERYKLSYEKIRDAGKDKSLVFPNWNKPTRDDRRIVYDKGAYVTHLLREEMGDKLFWKGIKEYTKKYWGKSVTTKDFQNSMESAGKKNLSEFFDKWIYLKMNKVY